MCLIRTFFLTFATGLETNQKRTDMEISEKLMETLEAIRKNTLLASKNVLTLEDVVLLTGYSIDRIRLLMHRREIPYYKPNGRKAFFDRKELDEWLKRNRVTPVTESDADAILRDYINNK